MWLVVKSGVGVPYDDRDRSISLSLRLKLLRFVGKQTWIPHGQDRLLRMIWPPDGQRSFAFEVDFFGMRYPGDLAQLLDWHVFAYRAPALKELTILADLASGLRKTKNKVTFFDIGANLGHHTLFMSQHVDEVIAFEPFPALRAKIRQKLELNHRSNVRVIPYALGDQDQILPYHPGGGENSGAGTFIPEECSDYEDTVEIEIRNGDDLFSEMNLPRMVLLKIDVEGFEPS